MYEIIDIDQWKRRDLFRLFQQYDNPTWDLLAEVEITEFYNAIKKEGFSFFLSFLYVGTRVCNIIEELRCRIDPSGCVLKYDIVHPGSTILYDDGTYGFGYFQFHLGLNAFLSEATLAFEAQKATKGVDSKDDDLARVYFSPIPWVSFAGFRHPYRGSGNSSIPMIVFGKHFERDGRRYLPVGLTLHHGLADGYHAGLFFNTLQDMLNTPADFLPGFQR